LRGWSVWSWTYVEVLAVAKDCRRTGIGSDLLLRAEAIARERDCSGIYLWTTSFQAPEFYKRHGYSEFGRLDNQPAGHSSHWMMKRLD
jgi:N-acetylglutamate synthase-like GNAT family acetyltransferase